MTSKAGIWVCNTCKDQGKDYSVPAGDEIGVILMRAHLKDEHGIRPPNTIRREL